MLREKFNCQLFIKMKMARHTKNQVSSWHYGLGGRGCHHQPFFGYSDVTLLCVGLKILPCCSTLSHPILHTCDSTCEITL